MNKAATLLSVLLLANTAALQPVAADDNLSRVIAAEKERLAKSEKELIDKKAELLALREQIGKIEVDLLNARSSKDLNLAIFVPTAVVATMGLALVKAARTPGSGAGVALARFAAGILGYPTTAIAGTAAAVTGYKFTMRTSDISRFEGEVSALKGKVDGKLAKIHENEIVIANAKLSICLYEEQRPADCEDAYNRALPNQ